MKVTKKTITEMARELRSDPTPSEKLLWKYIRRRQLSGYRFLRQKPFVYEQIQNNRYFYIADFYCAKLKLVIELDGKIHEYQKEYDYQRDIVLNNLGLQVLRINNEELLDMDKVLKKILEFC